MRLATIVEEYIPTPYRILGLRLRPFSLGHLLILERIECGYITGEDPKFEDLILGVLFCSMTWEEGCALLDDPRFPKIVGRWSRKINRTWFGMFPRGFNIIEKARLFVEYLEAGMQRAKAFVKEGASDQAISSPPEQMMKVVLMAELGFTESEIMNRPLRLCWRDYITVAERSGRVQAFDAEEQASLQAQADAFHKVWMKRHGAKVDGAGKG